MKRTWSPIFLISADKNCREQFNLQKQKLKNSKDVWKAEISSKTLQEKKTLKLSEIYQIRRSEADEAMSPMPDFDSCTGIVLFTWQCIYHAPISTPSIGSSFTNHSNGIIFFFRHTNGIIFTTPFYERALPSKLKKVPHFFFHQSLLLLK